jgi:hypothetical protein
MEKVLLKSVLIFHPVAVSSLYLSRGFQRVSKADKRSRLLSPLAPYSPLVCKGDLGLIVGRQQADLVEYSRQSTRSVCTSREPNQANLVALSVVLHQEAVCLSNVGAQGCANCHVESGRYPALQAPAIAVRVCPDSALVVAELGGVVFLESGKESVRRRAPEGQQRRATVDAKGRPHLTTLELSASNSSPVPSRQMTTFRYVWLACSLSVSTTAGITGGMQCVCKLITPADS